MALRSGHTVQKLSGEEWERQRSHWEGYTKGLVRLNPGGWIFPTHFLDFADRYSSFKFRASDVVVMTWPKSGTTWSQEIVWTMRNNPNLDHPEAGTHPMAGRVPFMEFDGIRGESDSTSHLLPNFMNLCPGRDPDDGIFIQMAECIKDPRTIKTHLPFSLLPPQLLDAAKVVAVFRNPKDLTVSYHHHCRLIKTHGFVGTFDDFIQYYVDGDLLYGPYWEHVREVWERRGHKNLHIMFYEDMKADIMKELRRLNEFLGTALTEAQLENVAKHTSFGSMKERAESVANAPKKLEAEVKDGEKKEEDGPFNMEVMKKDGGFFRKGQAGDWKSKFTPGQEAKLDACITKHFDPMGVTFKFA